MPDIENLRKLAGLLNVSIDYLLDDGKKVDFSVMREEIDLSRYHYDKKNANCPRLPQKTGRKDMVVVEKYPDAEKVSGNSFVIGDFKFTVCGKKTISFMAD